MRRTLVGLVVIAARVAAADPQPEHDDPALDSAMPTGLEGLDATYTHDRARLVLSPNLVVDRDAQTWTDAANDAVGWRTRARLAHELGGGIVLDVDAGVGAVASRFGSGTYAEAGIGLTKLFRFSNGTTAWIGLGANVRAWQQAPRQTAFMLRAGVTFR